MSDLDNIFAEWNLDFDEPVNYEKKIKTDVKPIGGLFRWTELVPELKTIIISHLDYVTRTRLSFCSKQDYDIVNATPIQINSIELFEHHIFEDSEGFIRKHADVNIKFGNGTDSNDSLKLQFVHKRNGTEISWVAHPRFSRPERRSELLIDTDYYIEFVKFLEKWLKKSRHSVKSMKTNMKFPESSQIQFLSQCKQLQVNNSNESVLKSWLEKVPPNLEYMELSKNWESPVSSQLLSMDHFKMCEELRIWGPCNFTDEQFLHFSGKKINIECGTITDRAINQFIREWRDGRTRENFLFFAVWVHRVVVKDDILRNLTVRPWDEQSERKSNIFSSDWNLQQVMSGQFSHQISKNDGSGTSATLQITNDCIVFAVTGRRMENNGKTYTYYSTP